MRSGRKLTRRYYALLLSGVGLLFGLLFGALLLERNISDLAALAGAAGADPAAIAPLQGQAERLLFWAHPMRVSVGLVLGAIGLFVFRPLAIRRAAIVREVVRARSDAAYQRSHDPVTGLPNIIALRDRLTQLSATAQADIHVAVIRIQVRAFKAISDAMGSAAGEELLTESARIIGDNIRRGDMLCRIGTDDFIILLWDRDAGRAASMAGRISDLLARPVRVRDTMRVPGAQIGIAAATGANIDGEALLANSSLALREAEASGGDLVFYEPAMRTALVRREAISRDLDEGLRRDELEPYFQPQIDLRTGAVIGFEALVRWFHPERGFLSPADFLDVAERTGQTEQIGEMMLRKSLDALDRWERAGHVVDGVGLNFSTAELCNTGLVDRMNWTIDKAGMDPSRIRIEILETVLIPDTGEEGDLRVLRNIEALSRAGFTIEFDDFGTGHTSISNLRRLAIDRLKIDRSFITGVDSDLEQQSMVTAMVQMAAALDIETLAEGLETEGEMRAVTDLGCQYGQGYIIGRPMPVADTFDWLDSWPSSNVCTRLGAAKPQRHLA
ncbi:putative bifunctional diguanylate cyclase/phosphodiesterase [Oceanomicrobium pacificus]|uniref:EAL domain-containing protein n=1 Tax=Oceanomicrobium pacificus TaxID=2692916 RepID=A0A6B0TPD3_9RHOB|nr:GGDEF domain-containing phosphodiesterase [Oceanomicrobium pacificus]MXU66427.1 EAL domain-containing protein [Oceanomicrobium pacificus]